MAAEDIFQLQEWVRNGKIELLDIYVGEIFPSSYRVEWNMLSSAYSEGGVCYNRGRVAVFRNHSKIIAGSGDKFAFGAELSANINTNPRTENGCLTISKGLYQFYKTYFDGIISFTYGTE